MATMPTPTPDSGQGTAQPTGGASGPASPSQGAPSQGQANDLQMLLAQWYQAAKQMAAADPRLASGAEKVSQGIQEMQTALVTPPQSQPVGQNPPY